MICGFAKEDRFLHDRLNHGHDSGRVLSSKQVVGISVSVEPTTHGTKPMDL